MDLSRISELLSPFVTLNNEQLAATSTYIDLLLKWNARISLTAIRDPQEVVTRHFGESYFAAHQLVADDWVGSVIDLGSGPGFPGIPLAILRPKAVVTLIESNGKKATFLSEVIGRLGLKNESVFHGRGESFPGRADLVVMRAVERFEQVLEVAARLVANDGRLALLIGMNQAELAKSVLPGIQWNDPVALPEGNSRIILAGKTAVGKL